MTVWLNASTAEKVLLLHATEIPNLTSQIIQLNANPKLRNIKQLLNQTNWRDSQVTTSLRIIAKVLVVFE